jgi:SNF2 family DNA or RNA helicase
MRKPYPYQIPAIQCGIDRNLFLNDECGLGKKMTCIEIVRALHYAKPTLVVTVKRDTRQWEREIHEQDPNAVVVIGTVDVIWLPDDLRCWLVMHYEALVRHAHALSRVKWGVIVLDEGHYIKNWQAQRSRAVKQLRADRKIVATGTPLDKTPEDLWSPLEFLYPRIYHGRLRAFREQYVITKIGYGGHPKTLIGCKQPRLLAKELAPFTFARTKDEVAPDLPPNIRKVVYIDLTGHQEAAYRRIKHATDVEVMGPELSDPLYLPSRMTQLMRLQQVAVDPELLNITAESAKYEWLYDWRADNPEEPLIVFTTFREVAKKVAKQLKAHLIIGGERLPDKWTRNTLVGTIGAASTALDLGWIRTGIFLDVTWKSLLMTQAINRIHRINNTQPCQTIFLTATNTVDEVMLEAVEKKWGEYEILRNYVMRFATSNR